MSGTLGIDPVIFRDVKVVVPEYWEGEKAANTGLCYNYDKDWRCTALFSASYQLILCYDSDWELQKTINLSAHIKNIQGLGYWNGYYYAWGCLPGEDDIPANQIIVKVDENEVKHDQFSTENLLVQSKNASLDIKDGFIYLRDNYGDTVEPQKPGIKKVSLTGVLEDEFGVTGLSGEGLTFWSYQGVEYYIIGRNSLISVYRVSDDGLEFSFSNPACLPDGAGGWDYDGEGMFVKDNKLYRNADVLYHQSTKDDHPLKVNGCFIMDLAVAYRLNL